MGVKSGIFRRIVGKGMSTRPFASTPLGNDLVSYYRLRVAEPGVPAGLEPQPTADYLLGAVRRVHVLRLPRGSGRAYSRRLCLAQHLLSAGTEYY